MRFSLDRVEPFVARWYVRPQKATHVCLVGMVAAVTGLPRQRVAGWARRGLTYRAADELACALGLHPALVWPEWFE